MYALFKLLFALKVAFCSCRPEIRKADFKRGRPIYKVTRIGRLPQKITESSGLAYQAKRQTFWTHNDSGGRPVLYEVNRDGSITDSLSLPQLTNTDWEALAQQDSTVLYIGDLGNNQRSRPTLTIYQVDTRQPQSAKAVHIAYKATGPKNAEQTEPDYNADTEAMLYFDDNLYIFTKNVSLKSRVLAGHQVQLYRLPVGSIGSSGQTVTLRPEDTLAVRAMVTGADVSPDGRLFALLTYGKVLMFDIVNRRINFEQPRYCIRLPRGQTEAICFVSPTDFVLTNEKGKLFLVRRK